MKKFFSLLIALVVLFSSFGSPLFAGGLGDIIGRNKKEIEKQKEIMYERQRREEERRRWEQDERTRQKLEEERNRSQIKQQIERDRYEREQIAIREQAARDEYNRQRQLDDLRFQQQLELERERQESERQARSKPSQQPEANSFTPEDMSGVGVNEGDVLVTLHIYPDKTYRIERQFFMSIEEVKDFCDSNYPGKTVRVKEIKH